VLEHGQAAGAALVFLGQVGGLKHEKICGEGREGESGGESLADRNAGDPCRVEHFLRRGR
jgi:hypothetical protein